MTGTPEHGRASAIAAAIAALPGVAEQLVLRHADDDAGRCRECVRSDRGPEPWPCRIRTYADAAVRLQRPGS